MVTKIFVSQIDSTNSDGTTATNGSYIQLVGGVAVWAPGGAAGATGYVGSIGSAGFRGSTGFEGSMGAPGLVGPMGTEGYFGSTGYTGSAGGAGFVGSAGFGGFIGSTGFSGSMGIPGFQGSMSGGGFRGSAGFNGSVGDSGYRGSVGPAGYVGSAGAAGGAGGFPFNFLTDLSPNTYPTRANYLVKVNSSASGITLIDGNTYLTGTINQNLVFQPYANPQYFIQYPKFVSYSEKWKSITTPSNSVTLSGLEGSIFKVTLSPTSGSVVSITLPTTSDWWYNQHYTVVVYLKQDATGNRTVDWSLNNVKWATGDGIAATGPTLSSTAGYTDVVTFTTTDNGTTWYGFVSAKGFNG